MSEIILKGNFELHSEKLIFWHFVFTVLKVLSDHKVHNLETIVLFDKYQVLN